MENNIKVISQLLKEMRDKDCETNMKKKNSNVQVDTKKKKKNSDETDDDVQVSESYKEVEEKYVDRLISVSDEIAKLAKKMVESHKNACIASKKIQEIYKAGKRPSDKLIKIASNKLYSCKYVVRGLEDALDNLIQNKPAENVSESREAHYKNTSSPQKMNDRESKGAKEFINKHNTNTPDETNVDVAIKKNDDAAKNIVKASPMRHNDKKV